MQRGDRIGPYEVLAKLGEGGMGEVYRARDGRLNRDVAIKILPELFAQDPERLARFTREAQALASLNHPNVAHVYGVEDRALVMELVDGEDLAQRLARGPVPADDAVPIARQIASGLEAAHERGVVHRDLKPGNIRIASDGTAKILDFGLAKAMTDETAAAADPLNSPTFTSPATQMGVILGTAAYMAPEQARGKPVDKRADIWAFGCVVYEMLAGKRPFGGDTVTDALAAIVKDEPDWSALPPETPAVLRDVLRRCLVKDPRQRLRDIGDARIALERVDAPHDRSASPAVPVPARRLHWLAIAAAMTITAILAASAAWLVFRPAASPAPPLARFATSLPLEALPLRGGGAGLAFAPDGTSVVFASQPVLTSAPMLFRRRLAALDVERIPNTEGALAPFFSPDSRWIGYFTQTAVMKVSVDGEGPVKICDRTRFSRASWGPDGTIVLGTSQSYANGPLARVAASGGTPSDLTALTGGETAHQLPRLLPGARHIVFTAISPGRSDLAVVPIAGGPHQTLEIEGSGPVFVAPDHLLFAKGNGIFAVKFDLRTNRPSGTPVQVLDDAAVSSFAANVWIPQIDADAAGSVAFVNKRGTSSAIRWIAPASSPVGVPEGDYRTPSLSPDARRVVVSAGEVSPEIWLLDLDSGTRLLLASGRLGGTWPIWSHDARRVIYAGVSGDVMSVPVDGSGTPEILIARDTAVSMVPTAVARDGSFVVLTAEMRTGTHQTTRNRDIWLVRPGQKPVPFVATPADDRSGIVSPDGRWLAYSSSVSGRHEVYLKPLAGGGTIPVSVQGGTTPKWKRMDALFFLGVRELMRAPIQIDQMRPGAPVLAVTLPPNSGVDVSADGRVLAVETQAASTGTRDALHVLLHWGSSLK